MYTYTHIYIYTYSRVGNSGKLGSVQCHARARVVQTHNQPVPDTYRCLRKKSSSGEG